VEGLDVSWSAMRVQTACSASCSELEEGFRLTWVVNGSTFQVGLGGNDELGAKLSQRILLIQ